MLPETSSLSVGPGSVVAPPVLITVKATPFRAMRKFMESELTPPQRESVLAQLSSEFPEYAARMRGGTIMASDRLPLVMVNRLTELLAKTVGQPLEEFAKRAGALGAEEAVNTVLKIMISFFSPQRMLDKTPTIWKTLYSHGDLLVEHTDTTATVELKNLPTQSIAGCGRITGWFEWLAMKTGAKDVNVNHLECRARGGTRCIWKLVWR
ncbi:MAG TPA: hypothetical protein VHL58_18795 [Thermoanaerobaculia bacterium]|nr:hypothetical protein [Thermoanaerobaculia bacterium]